MNLKANKQAICFAVLIIIGIAFSTMIYSCNKKQDIAEATIAQLDNVPEIGAKLATDIYWYVRQHNCNIDELIEIKGIGEKRLENLKEVFE